MAIHKIVNTGYSDLEVKRFYYPAELYSYCPSCNKEVCEDGNDSYILYGGPGIQEVTFVCHTDEGYECAEWTETVDIVLTVKKTKEKTKNITVFDTEV